MNEGEILTTQGCDPALDELIAPAISTSRDLIRSAKKLRTRRERANRRRIARLMRDSLALEATITLTDEVMRVQSPEAAARLLRLAASKSSIRGFGIFNSFGIRSLAASSFALPKIAVSIVHRRVRSFSRDLILDATQNSLEKHISARKAQGLSININVLGEAVLGNDEASKRLESILEMMRRPEVSYISVKLSAIAAQIVTADLIGSKRRATEVLRTLYREANASHVFVNLDMEEYRDLAMTVLAFKSVLSEKEFVETNAGIVLQAYLPEAHSFFENLSEWSQARYKAHGSHIKIRIVKGANLAMERAEAELHGWTAAPYRSKAEVDASYLRLIDLALDKENENAVRIGIASHNLFHISWALEVAKKRNVLTQIDLEMLEGMANGEALALTALGHPVLLYAPVTYPSDFAAAVAYLVRRFDENTSPENYLHAAFEIDKKEELFASQEQRFRTAVRERHTIYTDSNRHSEADLLPQNGFKNHPESDPTDPTFLKSLLTEIERIKKTGISKASYGSKRDVDDAISEAKKAQTEWSALSIEERGLILENAARIMHEESARTIAIMTSDAGKTVAEAIPEISEAIDFANFYAASARNFRASTPLGTVLVVPPWNFPYAIPAGGVFAALAAGNTVILKPAPETVATTSQLADQIWRAGVPKEVLHFLPLPDDETGKYLVTHPRIDGVILTGSFATAQLFTEWRPEINLMAETSGKNAILISASADIDLAVKDLVQSAFGHAGQKCSAASVAIVDTSIYRNPAFFRQLKDATSSLRVGAGWDLSTSVGPIIRAPEAALERALTTLDEGESWLLEPEPIEGDVLMWRPGIKIGVKAGSWSHQNEWFGPVLALIEAPDFETGLEWQNQTEFGLTAGIQSLDQRECELWIDSIEAGNLYVNRGTTGAIVNRQPFGGWKRSSVGPNAKAGGWNYVNTLRNWPRVIEIRSAKFGVDEWWSTTGSKAVDHSELYVEKNFHRYRRYSKPILVFVDESTDPIELELIQHIATVTKVKIEVSGDFESLQGDYAKVRWLASSIPPTNELLTRGISVDHRPIAQRGDIETPRWLLEQSVSITHHRYGNTNAGPKPRVLGL